VHLKDEGARFEAPIEAVWAFVHSPEAHAAAHRSARNQRMKPLGENVALVTMEQEWDGSWFRVAQRVAALPPLGMATEVLEGPLAGSRMFQVYTPRGRRTGVDVYGEFVSSRIPRDQLEDAVRRFLTTVFEEDAAALRAAGRASGPSRAAPSG
jgi:hypothetical protein